MSPNRSVLALCAVLALAAPRPGSAAASGWDLTLDLWAGMSSRDVAAIRTRVATSTTSELLTSNDVVGASGLLRLGGFELGALWEGEFKFSSASSAVVSPLLGFAFDPIPWLRIELLGELGGHRVGDLASQEVENVEALRELWLPYAGIRPGISVRLPVTFGRMVVGLWAFGRWDLQRKSVDVTYAGSASAVPYEIGGSTYGLLGRIGLEL
jgi:hypothetical protein